MNYSTDRPIETGEQDLLGRASFSEQLGKAIYEYNGKDGLVIGLFGKWGTGKTSVINMAVNEITELAKDDENKPIIMKFAPWNYSDKDNLISMFFQSLKNKINVQDNEELKNKVGKALSDYAGAFDALSLVPVIGSGVAAILKTLAQAKGAELMECADLDMTRRILEDALIQAEKKIIIVIDDIDRLANSQIRDVFQLVKQVADFPNVIYLLAMDREVVRRALTDVHNIDGNEYLEKIIQVPFELPELKKSKLHNIFLNKLDQIINDLPGEVIWDRDYWSSVFRNCVEPYINTLRDVNRMINTFQRLKTEEEKYGIICSVIENVDITGLGIMARLINRMELAYGRLAGNSEEKDKQIISLTHLEKLEDIYVAKVRDIVNSEFILDRNEFNNVFYLWKCFDKDGVEAYLKGLLKTEVNKLEFI